MSKKNWSSILCVAAMILCLGALTFGQEITGTLSGTVRDTSGAVVPGATVTITDPSKGDQVVRTLTTNDNGEYSAPNLTISTYTITVEAPNFKKAVNTDVKLDVGARRTVDVALTAGNIDETVTIQADTVAVDLTSPTSGTIISGDQVRELSINNRNFTQLVALAPGVSSDLADQVYVGTTNPDGQANTVNLAVNGARSSQNTFTVDGADITDRGSNITIQAYPSVDSIGEFRVLRSLFPAESGRSGGGQVNVVTRSGTSKFRGSVYEFIRNDAFNANSFLNNAQTNPQFGRESNGKAKRPPLRYNNYGWTIGGPVYFFNFGENDGGMFRRYDKTFFFFSQEFRKDTRFAAANSVTVPDASLKAGIFPIPVCIARNNVATENCNIGNPGYLPANTPIPAAMLSPAAAAYIRDVYSHLPNPNNPSATNPYLASFSLGNLFKFRQEIVKIDHAFSDEFSGYYRYQHDKIPTHEGNALFSSGSGLPGVSDTDTDSPGSTHTLQLTYAVSPNLIIEGRYNYSYGAILSNNVGLLALANSSIPVTLPFANQRDRIPSLTGNGFTGLTSFGPYNNFSDKHNYTGSISWLKGSHSFKFGAVYSLYRKNENAIAGVNEGSFTAFSTALPAGVVSTGTQGTLNQNLQRWANFLVGNVFTNGFTQAKFDYTADLRQMAFEGYAQDEWKVRRNLTLYMGVRYSFFGSPWDKNGRLTNFVPQLFDRTQMPTITGSGTRVAGTGNNCNGIIANEQNFTTGPASFNCRPTVSPYGKFIYDAKKNNFAPRVGLAWDPFGTGTTSIRTGYGIYHEQVLNGPALQIIGANPPYQETIIGTNTRLDNPVGAVSGAPAVQSLRGIDTDFKTPYMQHWSFDVQRQLGKSTIVTVGYYGSKGTHLIGLTELNSIAPGVALNSMCNNAFNQIVQCQTPGYVFRNAGGSTVTTRVPNNPNANQTDPNTQTTDILILDQLRPYRGFRSIAMVQPRYGSNYHSLQVSAQHRLSGASQIGLAYTWSKNLTNNISDRSNSPQNTYDIQSEWGRAALDRRHVLNINYVYELPFFKGDHGAAGLLLGGWQVSGIVTFQTGLGFSATTSNFDPAGSGIINANPAGRPNLLCDPNANAPHTRNQWVTLECFQPNPGITQLTNAPNVFGTAQRAIIEGPPTRRVDFTLSKNFHFSERFRLQLRAEVFNIFNTTNYRSFVSTNITSTSFGVIGSTRDPRNMQFGAKFNF
ncbi:MAG: carboxypeptidase regulatory-like domain-containing protein [Acidobacteriota bacterium]